MLVVLSRSTCVVAVLGLILSPVAAWAAKPTAVEALKLVPVQKEVDFDVPEAKEIEKSVVEVETVGGITGWVVRSDGGQVLRRFLDTNGDNKVDQWCYFKDGIEVYRDIDANFNNKADQYRWLGTAGTRWGLDDDENGKIDSWKVISAEEVTAEVVAALRDRDAARFQRLLLTADDLKTLGLSVKQTGELTDKAAKASKAFADVAGKQRVVTAKSEWMQFGANKPGVVPAGTEGAAKDLIVYDNVTALIETGKDHGQLAVGTLIKVGDGWRMFDLPKNLAGEQAVASVGYFFQASFTSRPETGAAAPAGNASPELQKLVNDLERLDKQLATAKGEAEQARLNATRADLLEKIIGVATAAEDRNLWTRQYTETISAAIQTGGFPDGIKRLQTLLTTLSRQSDASDLIPYVKFRLMTAEYNRDLAQKDADFEKVNTAFQEKLQEFVKEYASSPDAAEAMLQLALGAEFAGKTADAVTWFSRIAKDFPSSDLAPKANGAKRRLESVGKTIPLKGKTLDGRSFDLTGASGKIVLIHYWATWCEPCKQDMETIKSLQAKYGTQGFYPVGVNLDNDPKDAAAFLKTKSLPWPQLYEEGGLESRLASELGILTLPTMILVGKDGKVLNRNAHAGELDEELKKLMR
jgi:thiol-disulfide isomerase/thioredoxin